MKIKSKYIDYDYESTYDLEVNHAEESTISKLLEKGNIKSIYAIKTIQSGNQFEIEIYPEFTRKQAADLSLKKNNKVAQKNLNSKNARKRVERLINANFDKGDIWITLTYDDKHIPNSIEEAQKIMKNYIRRINYERKKLNIADAKYVYVTEYNESKKIRCHHHMIIDGLLDMGTLESKWKHGRRNNIRRVQPDDSGLSGIGNYITKDPKGCKRWCSSLNLKQPVIRKNHHMFRKKQINQMIRNENMVREIIESKFKGMTYLDESVKYNERNSKTYISVRLAIPGGERKRE